VALSAPARRRWLPEAAAVTASRNHRLLLDMHIPDWDADFLARYVPADVAAAQAAAGAGSVMVYCQSHLGLCYWPTRVGRSHAAMGTRDWLAESKTALRQAGCEVFGYYSVIFNNEAWQAHPDWRIEPRPPLPGWANARDRYGQVCPNNMGYRSFVEAELDELFSNYRFDAFFFDMSFWRGVCLCPACRQRFRAEGGGEIPLRIDWADPAWCAFQSARERWLIDFTGFLNALARRHGIARVFHNFAVSLFNWKFGVTTELGEHSDFLGGDFYGNQDEQFLSSRFMLNLSRSQPIEFMTSRCVHLTDHVSTKPLAQLQTQAFAALASSAAIRLIDAIDPQGTFCEPVYPLLASVFERLQPFQAWFGGAPVEDVAIYLSDHSKMSPAENGRDPSDPSALGLPSPHLTAARGAASALRQQQIPVGVITRKQLDRLADYAVVVLPEAMRLSLAEAAEFTAYVRGGGALYVSGMTGTYTLTGRTEDSLLGECLGLDFLHPLPGKTFYLCPTDEAWRSLCQPQPSLCVHDGMQAVAVSSVDVDVLGTVTLPYGHPSEGTLADQHWASIHSAPPGRATSMPAITVHRYGLGRTVYVAAAIERNEHHVARKTFQWLISGLLDRGPSFCVEAPSHVWLTVFHQPEQRRFVLHLLNYPSDLPATPIHDLQIVIRKQPERVFRKLTQAPDGPVLPLKDCSGTHVKARLAELADYAMLVLDYAPELLR
jgi:hypothetical protein